MARNKRGRAVPAYEEPQDPGVYEHLRNSLPGQPIPGIRPDVVGGYRYNPPDKEDTVVLGHPEVAGQYVTKYDHNDRFLGDLNDAPTERTDLNYEGPEEIRRRSKGSPFG